MADILLLRKIINVIICLKLLQKAIFLSQLIFYLLTDNMWQEKSEYLAEVDRQKE